MSATIDSLTDFVTSAGFRGKGPLCVALVVTEHARSRGLPLDPAMLVTAGEGQVLGLGKAAVQSILKRHGITKTLASEGGRTSRGSMGNMRSYVEFLNGLAVTSAVDMDEVEQFWIARVLDHFSAKPFILKADPTLSVRAMVRALMDQVETRQKSASGMMLVGTVMQHLVGAKLTVALGQRASINHHSASTNDSSSRGGDFDIGDVSIHVTVAPAQALIEKCRHNVDSGRKPIIVTTRQRAEIAEALAEDSGLAERVDVIEFEQFIATNIHEIGGFERAGRGEAIDDIVSAYNAIVEQFETDPSLRIELSGRA